MPTQRLKLLWSSVVYKEIQLERFTKQRRGSTSRAVAGAPLGWTAPKESDTRWDLLLTACPQLLCSGSGTASAGRLPAPVLRTASLQEGLGGLQQCDPMLRELNYATSPYLKPYHLHPFCPVLASLSLTSRTKEVKQEVSSGTSKGL